MTAVKREVGPDRYAILLPLNEFEPLLSLAIQQPEPLLRDGGRYGNFRSAGFKRALGFYKEMFDRKLAPVVTNNQISNVWDEFGKGFYSYYISGPWNIAKFKERLPPAQQGDWMTMPLPGPDGPGASLANGTSFVVFGQSRHKAAAWKLIALPVHAADPGAIPCAHRRPAAAAFAVANTGAGERSVCQGVP